MVGGTTAVAVASTLPGVLDPTAVLRRASAVPGCKNIPVPNSPLICSFLVGLDGNTNNGGGNASSKMARISVFTDTGTVSVGRILQGNFRQVFWRNVTSLDVIETVLRDPPQLTTIDASLIGGTNNKKKTIAQSQLELAAVGCAMLEKEKSKLQTHVTVLEEVLRQRNVAQQKQQQQQAQQQQQQPSPIKVPKSPVASAAAAADSTPKSPGGDSVQSANGLSGMEFQFSLPPDAMKDVDRCLTDIHSMGKLVRKVATNGRGTVFLYGNGGVAYTPQIPKALYHRLSQLRHSSYEHRPAYVSLGSRDRYYCSFHDGTYAFKGPKGLDRELKKAKKGSQPVSVAFGATYDTFCVVFSDGSWKCGGRAVPAELEQRLGKRRDVATANLGPEGEWFLKSRQNKMWWGGIHSELEAAIDDLMDAGHQLHFLDFGDEGSYFVSYD